MKAQRRTVDFLGTYFSKEAVMRTASMAKILAWVVMTIYAFDWLIQTIAILLQIARGFWTGLGFTDYAQSILALFEQPLRGLVYFVVLQCAAHILLMFMDIEDNTRRAARK
jgi:hypothetical protein